MISKLELRIKELKEKRARIRNYIKELEQDKEYNDLANTCKGQVIELLDEIWYLEKLVNELKGEK